MDDKLKEKRLTEESVYNLSKIFDADSNFTQNRAYGLLRVTVIPCHYLSLHHGQAPRTKTLLSLPSSAKHLCILLKIL